MKKETFIDNIIKQLEEYQNSKYIEGFMDAILYIKLLQESSKDIAQFYVKFDVIYNHFQRLGKEIEEFDLEDGDVIAWMPLPEPYTESEENEIDKNS